MPWSADHKVRTRHRILEAAATLFTHHGFTEASIDDVMRHAGLTRGAFYAHFASKGELHAESLLHAARSQAHRLEGVAPRELAPGYLSQAHRQGEAINCPLACLVSDVAQQDKRVRDTYTRLFAGFVARCQDADASSPDRERTLQRAVALIGGMAIARTLSDDTLAEEVLAACRAQVSPEDDD
ncbi:TetR/AcrR family transcriptional regulator [Halomonas koreensis]|uniref:TetR/AcrR family transcriptional regulator n=1 Tax=Halomonas koreensis TaxID=245385 RepID=A0ABU1G655_9GAMM|nr:TetR/AcrR family transcriptional regulator [Halomonas koreensis]MDR5868424.1 TetR/AcrR family transcriptional regulator [Halomonas koreensis]